MGDSPVNWNKRLLGAALAAFLGLGSTGFAQDSPTGPKKYFSRKTSFRIPVRIDEQERDSLKELRLFVRTPDGDWVCKDHAGVTQTAFSFHADRDGEYCFCIVTVDKTGKAAPEDPSREEPGLIVVVDTQTPEIDVRPLTVASGQVYLQCRMLDANPDYSSVKIEYQTLDGAWKAMEGLANTPGVVLVPNPSVLDSKVRVHAADKAGNVVEREIDLKLVKTPSSPAGPRAKLPEPGAETAPLPPAPPSAPAVTMPAPLKIIGPSSSTSEKAALLNDSITPAPVMVNATRCRIDFDVDAAPKGIAQVEVWITADNGRSWQMGGVSQDGKSPALAEFPGDGKYGYMFRVKPVRGLCPPPPKSGDSADGWIDVDTTKPVAELLSAGVDEEKDPGQLVITWVAKDANLGAQPISIYYATQPTGPWLLIAERIANTGSHRWEVPKGVGTEVLVRLEVTDKAGNLARCETPSPVQVAAPRPKVRVLNVAPAKD
jgi:hypothetical protein